MSAMFLHRWQRWLVGLLVWTALGFYFASQTYMTYVYASGKAPWGTILKLSLGEWYVWAAIAPIVIWLARRLDFRAGHRVWSVAGHFPASLVCTFVKLNAEDLVRQYVLGIPGRTNIVSKLHLTFLTYWGIVGVTLAMDAARRARERELRASQLEARLAEARLEMLRMQLHPHFLFNTLHAISALVHEDPEAADRMIAALSDLLRMALESAAEQEVPLRQELDFLNRYLEIQQMRFGDRLGVKLDAAAETLDVLVPNMMIQPLVENAIRHGIAPRAEGGALEISSRRRGERLAIEICDDGPGLPQNSIEGIGLTNTRARLAHLYGNEQHFAIENREGRGACVRLEIPWRTNGARAERKA